LRQDRREYELWRRTQGRDGASTVLKKRRSEIGTTCFRSLGIRTNPTGGRKPINAKCETVRDLPTFRDAYRKRRCIVPVDGFFEWKAIKGQKAKQPYAIAMNDGAPFGIAGIWENWKDPASGEWIRTFAIITTDANELVADIHDRMPVILSRSDYARWLSEEDAEASPVGRERFQTVTILATWAPVS
jgi:putative SOS response-associated peptidase YedK